MPDFSDLDFAKVDVGRLERRGFPEAAFAEGKSPDDLTKILETLVEKNGVALATRAKPNQYKKVIQALPDARFESVGRCIVIERKPLPRSALVFICSSNEWTFCNFTTLARSKRERLRPLRTPQNPNGFAG